MSSITDVSRLTVTVTSTVASSSAASTRAPAQGGILEGENPSTYDPKNPIILFIIQVNGCQGQTLCIADKSISRPALSSSSVVFSIIRSPSCGSLASSLK